MSFILTTLSIALGIVLASILMVVIIAQPWVMKAYAKLVLRSMEDMTKIAEEAIEKDQ